MKSELSLPIISRWRRKSTETITYSGRCFSKDKLPDTIRLALNTNLHIVATRIIAS